jgi:uncharacterized protein GlcG (DUF336 family)
MPVPTWVLTEEDAAGIGSSALDAARARGLTVTVAVAVAEVAGYPIFLRRMDGTRITTVPIAMGKAKTAALFQRPSGYYQTSTAPGGVGYGLPNLFPGELAPLPGGQPIVLDGRCIGGVGVSGGMPEEDVELASAAVAAFEQAFSSRIAPQ